MSLPHTMIVGGTRGTGRAIARSFIAEGHQVSVLGRRPPPESDQLQSGLSWRAVDVAEGAATVACFHDLVRAHGELTNLVFVQRYRGEGDEWDGELAVSVTATRRLIDLAAQHFAASGSIVIVASVAARYIALEQGPGYHVAKAAVVQLARFYATRLAGRGIRVNCVSPAVIVKEENQRFYDSHPELVEALKAASPSGRLVHAEDVADVVGLLCSRRAALLTGQELVLDGGISLVASQSLLRQLVTRSDS